MILYIVRLPARRINRMEEMLDMKHTAIYVRQSADRADSVSLETQEQLCRRDVPPDAVKPGGYLIRDHQSGRIAERDRLRACFNRSRKQPGKERRIAAGRVARDQFHIFRQLPAGPDRLVHLPDHRVRCGDDTSPGHEVVSPGSCQ